MNNQSDIAAICRTQYVISRLLTLHKSAIFSKKLSINFQIPIDLIIRIILIFRMFQEIKNP